MPAGISSARRALRARDARGAHRGADAGLHRSAARSRVPGGAGLAAARTTSGGPRRSMRRAGWWPRPDARPADGVRVLLEARGPDPHRARTRSTTRSARPCWPKRMGKRAHRRRNRRRPARRGDGHGACAAGASSATSTWAPRTCARQALNVVRMRLLGAEVRPVDAGSKTLEGRDQRGHARLGGQRRATPTTCSARRWAPHPYPLMVREFQAVIGREARVQILEQVGRLPDVVGRLRRRRQQRHRHLRRLRGRRGRAADRRRGGRRAIAPGHHAARFRVAAPACCRARARSCCRTTTATSS